MSKVEVNFLKTENVFQGNGIDLNKEIVTNPTSTFFFKWNGNPKKVLVVDRSINISKGKKVIYEYNQNLFVGEIENKNGSLLVRNKEEEIPVEFGIEIWGVITHMILKI